MKKYNEQETIKQYDTNIVRPQVLDSEVKLRGANLDKKELKKIKEALITFHCLETMATNIYRFQATKAKTELNRQLTAAMLNEMTHIQDFQVKLLEYGFKPSILACFFYVVGAVIGCSSRLCGEKAIKKTGIWVEKKAVAHYKHLLETVNWDEETRKVIEKDWVDEFHHIDVWSK